MHIKPCRFCKTTEGEGDDEGKYLRKTVSFSKFERQQLWHVECDICGAQGPEAHTEEEAINRWNSGVKKEDAVCWSR